MVFLATFFIFIGCKDAEKKGVDVADGPEAFSFQNFPQERPIDQKALPIVNSWPEFKAMENSFSVLKRALNTEDLMLAIDDLIEKEKELSEASYPEEFDKLQIRSRQQVFRTFLYKVKGNLVDRRDVNKPMNQLLEAYNALIEQFNVLINNTLDAKLILDEA